MELTHLTQPSWRVCSGPGNHPPLAKMVSAHMQLASGVSGQVRLCHCHLSVLASIAHLNLFLTQVSLGNKERSKGMFYKALQSCPWAKVSFKRRACYLQLPKALPASLRLAVFGCVLRGTRVPCDCPCSSRCCSVGELFSQHSPAMARGPCPTQTKR